MLLSYWLGSFWGKRQGQAEQAVGRSRRKSERRRQQAGELVARSVENLEGRALLAAAVTPLGGAITANTLVNALQFPVGTTISNIVYTGNAQAAGLYSGFQDAGSDQGLGTASGILLSTGRVVDALGPNSSDSISTAHSAPGDTALSALVGGAVTNDAVVLEFDVIPGGSALSFNYVFASDEYNEFVPAQFPFNDVFAILVSGGTEYPSAVNVATSTGAVGGPAMTIKNVNGTSTPSLFFNNDPSELGPTTPYRTQYDGFTNIADPVFSPSIAVTPGATYHVKLALADVGDRFRDTAVFLPTGSLVGKKADISVVKTAQYAGPPVVVIPPATGIAPSTTFQYLLTVTNNGPDDATNVTVQDVFPAGAAGFTFVNAGLSQGTIASVNTAGGFTTVVANLGAMASGATALVTIDVTTPPTNGVTLSDTASVTRSEFDTDASNDTTTVSTFINNNPPTIQNIQNITVLEDQTSPVITIPFTVADVEDAETALSLLVNFDSSIIASITPTGPDASGNVTLTVTLVTNANTGPAGTNISVTVRDLNSSTTNDNFSLIILPVDDLPVFQATVGNQTISEDNTFPFILSPAFALTTLDPEQDEFVTATSSNQLLVPDANIQFAPTGGTGITAENQNMRITPLPNASGTTMITLVLHDGIGNTVTQSFVLTVNPVNDNPTMGVIAPQDLAEDIPLVLTITVDDVDSSLDNLQVTGASSNGLLVVSGSGFFVTGSGNSRTVTITPVLNAPRTPNPTVPPIGPVVFNRPAATTATITLTVLDDNTPVAGSSQQIFVITLNPLNDPAKFPDIPDTATTEDVPAFLFIDWTDPDSDPRLNTFSFTSSNTALVPSVDNPFASTAPGFAWQRSSQVIGGPMSSARETLKITPISGQTGTTIITVVSNDNDPADASVTIGGVTSFGTSLFTDTFILSVNTFDDPPQIQVFNQTMTEDGTLTYNFTVSDSDTPGPLTLTLLGSSDTNVVPNNVANLDLTGTGPIYTLTIRPSSDISGTTMISLAVENVDAVIVTNSFQLTVLPANDAPTVQVLPAQTTAEDTPIVNLPFTMGDIDSPIASLTVTAGSNNLGLIRPQDITFTGQGTANPTISLNPRQDQFGTAMITLTVSDGSQFSTSTFVLNVTPRNDVPTIRQITDILMTEDSVDGPTFYAGLLDDVDTPLANLVLTISSSNPTLLPTSGIVLTGSGSDRTLTVTPVANEFGTALVTIVVNDQDPTPTGPQTATRTFVVDVQPVNDMPSFTPGTDVAVLEDNIPGGGQVTVSGWATNINPGNTQESAQLVAFLVTNDNPGLFSQQPAIAPDGTLTFTLAPDQNGSANVTVQLQDDGGTLFGGADTSISSVFLITVSPVPDTPVISITPLPDVFVLEDSAPVTVDLSTAFYDPDVLTDGDVLSYTILDISTTNASLLTTPSVGAVAGNSFQLSFGTEQSGTATIVVEARDLSGATVTDTFVVTVVNVEDPPLISPSLPNISIGMSSTVNFTVSDPDTPIGSVAVSVTSSNPSLVPATLGGSGASRSVDLNPAVNQTGTSLVTITANDGTTTVTSTFVVTVIDLNDAPTFTAGPSQTVLEDATAQSLAWATNINPGAPNESGQSLNFVVTNDNNGLFSSQPAISPTGVLTYTLAANANGAANVTVRLQDDGGTAGGGQDTSATQVFTITAVPVNDAPSFLLPLANQNINQPAGAQTVASFAQVSVGPTNESSQSLLGFTVSNNNPSLFQVAPAIAANGTLTYTPMPGVLGTATVQVTVTDNGGIDNGGSDTSITQSFTITVNPAAARRFDMNASTNQTASGYTGVRGSHLYTTTRGYGWTKTATEFDRNNPSTNLLLRDGHNGSAGRNGAAGNTFNVDLAQSGQYFVSVIMGDASYKRDLMSIAAEGSSVASGITTLKGEFKQITFTVNVTDGQLNLDFNDAGGDTFWTVSSIEVRPLTGDGAVSTLNISRSVPPGTGDLAGDAATVDTYVGTGATANALVTINVSDGTVTTTDANANHFGSQVLADASGNFTFQVRRPYHLSSSTIQAVETTGAGYSNVWTQNYTEASMRLFDMNASAASLTQTGYVPVLPTELYNSSRGFGWVTATTGRTLAAGSISGTDPELNLLRDGQLGTDRTFQIRVEPFVNYALTLKFRDTILRDKIYVYVELPTGVSPLTSNAQIANLSVPANTTVVKTAQSTVFAGADGILDIRFKDFGGDANFIINAIELTRVGLSAASVGAGTSQLLTQSQLNSVVDAAISNWQAAGITAAQAAKLRSLEYRVDSLRGADLGLATGQTIFIDNDGAGNGWFVDSTPGDNSEFNAGLVATSGPAAGRIDLLTAVMHEMGHALGLDHDDDGVMAKKLATGTRELPAAIDAVFSSASSKSSLSLF